jgi:hypothetical protein
MELSGQLYAPATLLPGKGAPGTRCKGHWVVGRDHMDAKAKSLTSAGSRSSVIRPVDRRYFS